MVNRSEGAPHESWSAAEWEARADHAQAYLDGDPGWKVGPDVVAMYRKGAERARARELEAAGDRD